MLLQSVVQSKLIKTKHFGEIRFVFYFPTQLTMIKMFRQVYNNASAVVTVHTTHNSAGNVAYIRLGIKIQSPFRSPHMNTFRAPSPVHTSLHPCQPVGTVYWHVVKRAVSSAPPPSTNTTHPSQQPQPVPTRNDNK